MSTDAFHLPGLTDDDVVDWIEHTASGESLTWRVPQLAPGAVRNLCSALRHRRENARAHMTAATIVRAIDRVARRLLDPRDPLRREAETLLPAVTGYTPEMVRHGLDRTARDWTAEALGRLVQAELEPEQFPPEGAPALAFHIFAGNVPGVAVTSLVRALLTGAASFGKTARGEPILAPLFVRALADADARIGDCIAVTYWPGGNETYESEAAASADIVVFYGGADAAEAVRSCVGRDTRLVEHGPRIAFGLAGREALCDLHTARVLAHHVAYATAIFDQQGCVSPHIVFAEQGGAIDPRAFAALVEQALAALEPSLPRGRISPADAAAILDLRATAGFRALEHDDIIVLAPDDTRHTVLYDAQAGLIASPLNRTLRIASVSDLEDVPHRVAPFRDWLQTAALEGAGARSLALSRALRDAGVTRITDFERMPWPRAWEPHDGRGPLRELLS